VIPKGALVADHLDWDLHNNDPTNIVPSCNHCNAHRTRAGDRRRIEEGELVIVVAQRHSASRNQAQCETCGNEFVADGGADPQREGTVLLPLLRPEDQQDQPKGTSRRMSATTQDDVKSFREHLRNFEGGRWAGHASRSDAELADAVAQAKAWIGGRRYSWHIVAKNVLEDGRPHP
jgi:hypothetical protein